jgi:hypothetical protein
MIIRTEKNKDYTVIANFALNDNNLSLKAKGLWAYIMTKPDKWNINGRGLAEQLKESRPTINTILKELEEHGYLQRGVVRENNGKFSQSENILYEKPWTSLPWTKNPSTVNLSTKVNTITSNINSDKSLTIKEKTKLDSDISFDADETKEPVPVVNDTTTPTTKKLFYDVCKKYGLFITNHNNVRKWANDMETMDDGVAYLQTLLDKDIRTMEGEFKPTLNTPFDIVSKKLKIQRFLNGGESAKPYDPRVGSF